MASQSVSEAIEHIVLFKVKDEAEPSKVKAWLDALNGLSSLDQVAQLTAAPLIQTTTTTTTSSATSLNFTHILHSRYNSKQDLKAYTIHPRHDSAVKDHGLHIVEDIMAFDWVAPDLRLAVTPKPKPGSAVRVSFFKLKEEEEEDVKKSEILGVLKETKDGLLLGQQKQISEMSYGENFSPERSRGYSLAYLAVFPGPTELEDSNEELGKLKHKFKDFVESEVVVDFLIPSSV
ncbi:stress-response A/B barrel domain-containing protein UP3 [Quercus suber]|uniref:Stress-response a/b barrel domain-containing protein up3 n=1 Tax=Quercus suber TaxID=58331 RepID=A0AAW0K2M9_QUESU|nr:stress-response A/B barrel domain-containing protein UP3-like [Quercus suber]POF19217.1 stress-response a/b barrel domain-containing protein up3 [Quercus suber]